MCLCLYATIRVGEIQICLYKHRISLEQNTRKILGFAPRLANWVAGEQVHCILICTFKILYHIQVLLAKMFFNITKLKRREC